MTTETHYLPIGEFAKICGVSVQTLRYYDRHGFLKPIYVDPTSHYRYYAKDQFFLLTNIRLLQSIGFSLTEIKSVLSKQNILEVADLYQKKRQEVEVQITQLQQKKEQIGCYLDFFHSMLSVVSPITKDQINKIQLKAFSPKTVVFVRDRVTFDYPNMMLFYNQLLDLIFKNAFKVANPLISVFHAGYHDIYHQKIDIELSMELWGDVEPHPNVRQLSYETVLSCIHQGKYPSSLPTYEKMVTWVQRHHYQVVGPVMHILLIPIAATQPLDETTFEILLPVEPL